MRLSITFFCVLLASCIYGQDLETIPANTFGTEQAAQTFIKLYQMDAGQANQYKNLLDRKQKDMMEIQEKALSPTEKVTLVSQIQKNYDNELLSFLNEDQRRTYKIQQNIMQSIRQQNTNSSKIPQARNLKNTDK